jgi:hypothetical protein
MKTCGEDTITNEGRIEGIGEGMDPVQKMDCRTKGELIWKPPQPNSCENAKIAQATDNDHERKDHAQ